MIDGRQRVTALTAAILGNYVINKEYKRVRIRIAFNPVEEKFIRELIGKLNGNIYQKTLFDVYESA